MWNSPTSRHFACDAHALRRPAALGAIGTLLLHAVLVASAILGTRAPSAAAYPYIAAGADGDALLLLPASPANVDVRRLEDSSPQKLVPPKLVVSLEDFAPPHALRIDSSQPEAEQPSGIRVASISFVKSCRETYPDERRLDQDLAAVSLHGTHVEISSGDPQRALMALHCLQALGTLMPRL